MKKNLFSKVFMAIAMILAVVCVSFLPTSCEAKKHLIQSEKLTPSPDDPAPVNPDWYPNEVFQVVASHDEDSTTSSSIKVEKPIEPISLDTDETKDWRIIPIVDEDSNLILCLVGKHKDGSYLFISDRSSEKILSTINLQTGLDCKQDILIKAENKYDDPYDRIWEEDYYRSVREDHYRFLREYLHRSILEDLHRQLLNLK